MRRGPAAAPGDQRAALMLCLRHVGGYWIGCTSAEPSAALDRQARNELFWLQEAATCSDALLVMWRPLLDKDECCKVSGRRM